MIGHISDARHVSALICAQNQTAAQQARLRMLDKQARPAAAAAYKSRTFDGMPWPSTGRPASLGRRCRNVGAKLPFIGMPPGSRDACKQQVHRVQVLDRNKCAARNVTAAVFRTSAGPGVAGLMPECLAAVRCQPFHWAACSQPAAHLLPGLQALTRFSRAGKGSTWYCAASSRP
jgi:hypothetical protein